MSDAHSIKYLTRQEIDAYKWDNCIANASNGLIYAYSFYLDHMATQWDGLVWKDYEMVMPLPWRKKWGVFYLYQPFLTAQLGVFGHNLSAETVQAFLTAVPKKFWRWDFPLNQQNVFLLPGFPLYERMNFVLPLNKPYEALWKGYRDNIRRNVKKSRDYRCVWQKDIPLDAIIELTKLQAKEIPEADFIAFKKLFGSLKEKGIGKTYGIVSQKGELLASGAFIFSHNRAYYILVGNHPNGRTLGASHALINAFVQEHAEQDLLLDFEGSDTPSLAFFYQSFGARQEKYMAVKTNRGLLTLLR